MTLGHLRVALFYKKSRESVEQYTQSLPVYISPRGKHERNVNELMYCHALMIIDLLKYLGDDQGHDWKVFFHTIRHDHVHNQVAYLLSIC